MRARNSEIHARRSEIRARPIINYAHGFVTCAQGFVTCTHGCVTRSSGVALRARDMHGAAQLGENAACDTGGPFFESNDPVIDATRPTRAPSNSAPGRTTAAQRPKNHSRVSVRTAHDFEPAAPGFDPAARPTSEHADDPLPPAIDHHGRTHDPKTAAKAVRLPRAVCSPARKQSPEPLSSQKALPITRTPHPKRHRLIPPRSACELRSGWSRSE